MMSILSSGVIFLGIEEIRNASQLRDHLLLRTVRLYAAVRYAQLFASHGPYSQTPPAHGP